MAWHRVCARLCVLSIIRQLAPTVRLIPTPPGELVLDLERVGGVLEVVDEGKIHVKLREVDPTHDLEKCRGYLSRSWAGWS